MQLQFLPITQKNTKEQKKSIIKKVLKSILNFVFLFFSTKNLEQKNYKYSTEKSLVESQRITGIILRNSTKVKNGEQRFQNGWKMCEISKFNQQSLPFLLWYWTISLILFSTSFLFCSRFTSFFFFNWFHYMNYLPCTLPFLVIYQLLIDSSSMQTSWLTHRTKLVYSRL